MYIKVKYLSQGLDLSSTHNLGLSANGMYSALLHAFPSNAIRVDANHFQYNLAISFSA